MATNTPVLFYRGNPTYGATNSVKYISTAALTSNLVTITTSATHGITQVGTIVTIQGVSSVYDGIYSIYTIPTTTTFTYVKTNANIGSAAVSPNGVATFNTAVANGQAISNKAATNGFATLTTASSHSLSVNDFVTITIGDSSIDGTYLITAVPSTTTFVVPISSTTAIASAAVSQGAYGRHGALYTVPASTSIIVTNAIVTNPTASSLTFTINLDGQPLAYNTTLAANTTAFFDIKQFMATTKTITGYTSNALADFQISGITVT
jgi:hypothetical protein